MAKARLIHSLNALLLSRPVPPSSSPPGIHLSPPGRSHCLTRVVAGVGGGEWNNEGTFAVFHLRVIACALGPASPGPLLGGVGEIKTFLSLRAELSHPATLLRRRWDSYLGGGPVGSSRTDFTR